MPFPTINFKATGTELDQRLVELLEKKLSSLEHYVGNASSICEAEFAKEAPRQSGNVFRVEVNLTVNGDLFRADAVMDSFEKAIDEVRDELDKELRRTVKKKESMFRKGGRAIKEMLRGGS